jgi:hypothetical protein
MTPAELTKYHVELVEGLCLDRDTLSKVYAVTTELIRKTMVVYCPEALTGELRLTKEDMLCLFPTAELRAKHLESVTGRLAHHAMFGAKAFDISYTSGQVSIKTKDINNVVLDITQQESDYFSDYLFDLAGGARSLQINIDGKVTVNLPPPN